jgi:hypothetical protein
MQNNFKGNNSIILQRSAQYHNSTIKCSRNIIKDLNITPHEDNQGNIGGFRGGGCGGRRFAGGLGPVICHSCQKLGHYERDYPL